MDHLALLTGEVEAMVGALRGADLAAPVPACPGWTVREVAGHLTGVHRWVVGALKNEGPPPYDETPGDDVVGDYERAGTEMIARLQALAPDAQGVPLGSAPRLEAGRWAGPRQASHHHLCPGCRARRAAASEFRSGR